MNTKEKSTASTSQTKEPTVDEKKLSAYSLALCKEIKKVIEYVVYNIQQMELLRARDVPCPDLVRFGLFVHRIIT